MRHTPGPWRVVATPNGWTLYAADGSEVVADFDTEAANARLIAKAPEMYAALQTFINDINAVGVEYCEREWPDLVPSYHAACNLLTEIDGQ